MKRKLPKFAEQISLLAIPPKRWMVRSIGGSWTYTYFPAFSRQNVLAEHLLVGDLIR